jgi:amino acid transporter
MIARPQDTQSFLKRLKHIFIGRAHDIFDPRIFHQLSLIAFFAWVGLGADGLSSSCYGPEETFLALGAHTHLAIFVALASGVTVFVISTSYSQIIELFPTGGGGYLVASKLLSPKAGMVSGCALLIDYVLTITISVASGADAIFSFLPAGLLVYKLPFAIAVLFVLTVMNLRGVKESVLPLVPVFLMFIFTHAFFIIYALSSHLSDFSGVVSSTRLDIQKSHAELGLAGMFFIMLKAYSMGAGTYTGIEAVSNGLPILREPRAKTGKRTMRYMSISLAFTVMGLILAYLFFGVSHQPGKTLNAVLFETITKTWGSGIGYPLVLVTLISEAVLLFVAAQAGFLDGPRVLSNMALDRWFPTKFASLSDRLVTQKGILIMGVAGFIVMALTKGSVGLLVVLYSINVFITFSMSQLGMVRHWWLVRGSEHWKKKIIINGVGLTMTSFILVSVVVLKFNEGGWITIVVTAALVGLSLLIKRHYLNTMKLLHRLDSLVEAAGYRLTGPAEDEGSKRPVPEFNRSSKTAVLLVNGYNGLGLHTVLNVVRQFGDSFKNFAFVEVGVIDAGTFKGTEELERLQAKIKDDIAHYVGFMRKQGFYAEGFTAVGTDVVAEVGKVAPEILEKFPNAVFFGGQLVFPNPTLLTGFLHNYTIFAVQRYFYAQGIPIMMMPIRV